MYDLIYVGHGGGDLDSFTKEADKYQTKLKDDIKSKFPGAVIEDASDDIHGYRFSVTLPDDKLETYVRFALEEGFAGASMKIGFMRFKSDSGHSLLERILNEGKSSNVESKVADASTSQ